MNKIHPKLHELLIAAIKADGAFKGTLQRYNADGDHLEIVASEGFGPDFLAHFKKVKPFDSSCCGRAFGAGIPVMINDLETEPSFQPNLQVAYEAGFRAVKSVPIYSALGTKIGVVSTHFEQPLTSWNIARLNHFLPQFANALDELMPARMS
jgi:hypothetical protein